MVEWPITNSISKQKRRSKEHSKIDFIKKENKPGGGHSLKFITKTK